MEDSTNMSKDVKKRYRNRKKYKKLTQKEIKEKRNEAIININPDLEEYCIKRAGNEGETHIHNKIKIAITLHKKYENMFNSDYESDGVWFEYPLINSELKNYSKNKLKYLLSLYELINIDDTYFIKNLHNIFNPNLKSTLRGKKCIKSLEIIKIVDIAVVCNNKIVHVVEVAVKNKLTKDMEKNMNNISEKMDFFFEQIIIS